MSADQQCLDLVQAILNDFNSGSSTQACCRNETCNTDSATAFQNMILCNADQKCSHFLTPNLSAHTSTLVTKERWELICAMQPQHPAQPNQV